MKKRVGLAVNWFNYPICLSQAWFQQSCSNCGRKWQMLTWRRSTTTAATTATGALTCPPRHRQRTHSSTSMPLPTGSTWVTREKCESLPLQSLFYFFVVFYVICMCLTSFTCSHNGSVNTHIVQKAVPYIICNLQLLIRCETVFTVILV